MPITRGFPAPFGLAMFYGGADATPLGQKVEQLKTNSVVIMARHLSDDLVTNADVTAEVTIPSHGRVQLSTTDTTGGHVLVVFKRVR